MNWRGENMQAGIPHGECRILQHPGNAVLGLTQSWCVKGCIGGLCSTVEVDVASSVHTRRSGHRVDDTVLAVSITHHPSSPQSFPPGMSWRCALAHPMLGTGRDFAPQQASFRSYLAHWPRRQEGQVVTGDLARIYPWVPWVMPPAPWVLCLSNVPRHVPNKGQTLNGDKAFSQAL